MIRTVLRWKGGEPPAEISDLPESVSDGDVFLARWSCGEDFTGILAEARDHPLEPHAHDSRVGTDRAPSPEFFLQTTDPSEEFLQEIQGFHSRVSGAMKDHKNGNQQGSDHRDPRITSLVWEIRSTGGDRTRQSQRISDPRAGNWWLGFQAPPGNSGCRAVREAGKAYDHCGKWEGKTRQGSASSIEDRYLLGGGGGGEFYKYTQLCSFIVKSPNNVLI